MKWDDDKVINHNHQRMCEDVMDPDDDTEEVIYRCWKCVYIIRHKEYLWNLCVLQ